MCTWPQVISVTKEDFPLPQLGQRLRDLAAEVSLGRGFQVASYILLQPFWSDRQQLMFKLWLSLFVWLPIIRWQRRLRFMSDKHVKQFVCTEERAKTTR